MGWLEYDASGIGRVVDRYRWEEGCIVEHVSDKTSKWTLMLSEAAVNVT